MIYFIGAGPGAVDLITVRGAEILRKAQRIIYAGSLVNPEVLSAYASSECEVFDSSSLTLEEILALLIDGHNKGIITVRHHSGDPALYGAVREQFEALRDKNIPFEVVPGVSSLFAASASLKTEYMTPELSQTLIISRLEGRTPMPEREKLSSLAAHRSSLALFLSAGMLENVCDELIAGGYDKNTPAAVIYKASWPEERILRGTLETLPEISHGITKSAIILVGEFLNENKCAKSRLYDKNFSHEFRHGEAESIKISDDT